MSELISLPKVSRVLSGTGAPSAGAGSDSDIYMDTATNYLYVKISGSWRLVAAV